MGLNKVYIGIDPGANGGIAAITVTPDFLFSRRAWKMPDTERDIWDLIRGHDDALRDVASQKFAIIERVQGFIGKSPTTGSSMFKFGQGYGSLRMALVAANIAFEDHAPNMWQKAMGIVTRGKEESRTDFKNRLKARAQQLFPDVTVTLAVADALLIAEFCRRKQEGKL